VTATLPQEVRDAFGRFVTTEFTTIDARQQPIVWPVTPYYSPGAPTLDTSTGLGYPKKANDARRNPHVAMLFSDPTGSGIESGIQVLVQGAAEVDDRDLTANRKRYEHESAAKLGGARAVRYPRILHGVLGWYVNRIYIKVRPERVFVWPAGEVTEPPEVHDSHLEEVRSGHSEEPLEAHEPPTGGAVAWDHRIEALGRRYATAVLAWVAPDGFPLCVRLPVSLDPDSRRIVLGAQPAGLPLAEGRACLTAHSHSPDFNWRENFQVRGDLVRTGGGWALAPRKLVGGLELPNKGLLGRYRGNMGRSLRFYRTARRELKERKARAAG
jgi:pyridoxamine 5'-phosphate oxidase-like protein